MKIKFILILFKLLVFNIIVLSQDSFLIPENDLMVTETKQINKSKNKAFSLQKFSIGIYSGINFSQVIPLNRSSIFTGTETESFEKEYNILFKNIGSQLGCILIYNPVKIISISLQPVLIDYKYRYKNTYQWTGQNNLLYEADISHKLYFFELPLIIGLHTTYKRLQPYYQGGIYYGHLKSSRSDFSVVETSPNLTGSSQSINYSISVNSSDQYIQNQFGLLAGAGISYIFDGVKVGLEGNIRFLMSNLNSIESRYQNNVVISGNYDVPDRFKFSNLSINLNLVVPLACKNQNGGSGASLFCD